MQLETVLPVTLTSLVIQPDASHLFVCLLLCLSLLMWSSSAADTTLSAPTFFVPGTASLEFAEQVHLLAAH